jgi:hypothetical protein
VHSALGEALATVCASLRDVIGERAQGHGVDPDAAAAARLRAGTAVETASETVDLALTQGLPMGAMTTTWLRTVSMCEYIAYIADVVRAAALVDPLYRPPLEGWVAVADACDSVTVRLELWVLRILDLSEHVPDDYVWPSPPDIGEYSEAIRVAARAISASFDQWAAERRSDVAEGAVEMYWSLAWVGELDLMATNAAGMCREVRRDLDESAALSPS